jgi:hypothetical protein
MYLSFQKLFLTEISRANNVYEVIYVTKQGMLFPGGVGGVCAPSYARLLAQLNSADSPEVLRLLKEATERS